MEGEVLSNLSRKLGIKGSEVLENARELSRLASLKCRSLDLNGSAKSVICLELAASSYNIPVDRTMTFRLSGMATKKAYQHAYKTFECLLGKQKSYTVHDLAVQFGVLEAARFAEMLLKSYQEQFVHQVQEELCNPIFPAAALYSACRSQKVKIDKCKLLSLLSVKRSQFDHLVEEMNKISKNKMSEKSVGVSKRSFGMIDRLQEAVEENCRAAKRQKASGNTDENSVEDDYEEWKKQILLQATKRKS